MSWLAASKWLRQRLLLGFCESTKFISDPEFHTFTKGTGYFFPFFWNIRKSRWRLKNKPGTCSSPGPSEANARSRPQRRLVLRILHVKLIRFSVSEENTCFPRPATSSWRDFAANMEALLYWGWCKSSRRWRRYAGLPGSQLRPGKDGKRPGSC